MSNQKKDKEYDLNQIGDMVTQLISMVSSMKEENMKQFVKVDERLNNVELKVDGIEDKLLSLVDSHYDKAQELDRKIDRKIWEVKSAVAKQTEAKKQ
ncbi:hypothetical protein [Thermoactinomyces sp. DSM 45892]|uniref:hypothetical protein n=1 Tax=Thermoactinomyces sp. DSM 45892 TaxID=1882753 RepID=UPI000898F1D6|nr:hypothetical protein [Thermoactinomyces sp. DSM 45892]SDY85938.1 hypothetical protein SAMN05444416_10994 [Thermoactinomyces sp. DSM 45892]